ncbi:hypothetical protein [Hamadaea tsunoensis]|uniref:hypothetical protein n=1 Tax=Hamadaea tsunoensis TaxID=53368 RepID=UPI0003F776C5|nr:hypothetical protein [Hamadaea tsunoensis]
MLPQEHLIERVRELCLADDGLVAALTYGSFPQGCGDEHSDVEFWLFGRPDPAAARAWLDRIGEIRHVVVNEFGTHVVFFPGLVRGEFHFAAADEIAAVAQWPARSAPVDRMIILDRTGALRAALTSLPDAARVPVGGPAVEELCGRFANWLLLAHHVAARGELLRALDALTHVQRHLLWMSRLAAGQTHTWLTPSRRAETDLDGPSVGAVAAVAATADAAAVREALAAAWRRGRELWIELAGRTGRPVPEKLFADFDATLHPRPPR